MDSNKFRPKTIGEAKEIYKQSKGDSIHSDYKMLLRDHLDLLRNNSDLNSERRVIEITDYLNALYIGDYLIRNTSKNIYIVTFPVVDGFVDILKPSLEEVLKNKKIWRHLLLRRKAEVKVVALNGESEALGELDKYDNMGIVYGNTLNTRYDYRSCIMSGEAVLEIMTNPELMKDESPNNIEAHLQLSDTFINSSRINFKGVWKSLNKPN